MHKSLMRQDREKIISGHPRSASVSSLRFRFLLCFLTLCSPLAIKSNVCKAFINKSVRLILLCHNLSEKQPRKGYQVNIRTTKPSRGHPSPPPQNGDRQRLDPPFGRQHARYRPSKRSEGGKRFSQVQGCKASAILQ